MNYFLAKTEPGTYSIDQFEHDGTTIWDGVHSYAAIGFIKQMSIGDRVYIYHSLKGLAIVGEAEVVGEPYLNTADPRHSWAVELKFVRRFSGPTLAEFKAVPEFATFDLVRQSRLSVMKVPSEVATWINSRV
jgi:predicted RNA-binding protein with PUA-like domain